jgi:hypothetical protein
LYISFSTMCATCPAHFILLDSIILIIDEDYKLWSFSLGIFLQFPITSSLFGLHFLLSTLFSDTVNLCYSLNMRDQGSHPYKTTSKIKC